MDLKNLEIFAKIAGIGGLSLGIFLYIFREVIRKKFFSKLNSKESYLIIRLILVLTWSISVIGIVAWLYNNIIAEKSKIIVKDDIINANQLLSKYLELNKQNQDKEKGFFDILSDIESDLYNFQIQLIKHQNCIDMLNINFSNSKAQYENIKSIETEMYQIKTKINNSISYINNLKKYNILPTWSKKQHYRIIELKNSTFATLEKNRSKMKSLKLKYNIVDKSFSYNSQIRCKKIGFASMNKLSLNDKKLEIILNDIGKESYRMIYSSFRHIITKSKFDFKEKHNLQPQTLIDPATGSPILFANMLATNSFHNQISQEYKEYMKKVADFNNACLIIFPTISRESINAEETVNKFFILSINVYNPQYNSISRRGIILDNKLLNDFNLFKKRVRTAINDTVNDLV